MADPVPRGSARADPRVPTQAEQYRHRLHEGGKSHQAQHHAAVSAPRPDRSVKADAEKGHGDAVDGPEDRPSKVNAHVPIVSLRAQRAAAAIDCCLRAAEAEALAAAEAADEAARERAELRRWTDWFRTHPEALVETAPGYWTVLDELGQDRGSVNGGGPTRDHAYKGISPRDVEMNPDVAPGYPAATKEGAAAALLVFG